LRVAQATLLMGRPCGELRFTGYSDDEGGRFELQIRTADRVRFG